jgi:hypothetical protein
VWPAALPAAGDTWVVERKAQEEVAPEVLVGRSIDEGVRATTGLGERGNVFEVAEREGALGQLWRYGRYHDHVTDRETGQLARKNAWLFPGISRPWAVRLGPEEVPESRIELVVRVCPVPELPGFPGRCFRADICVAASLIWKRHATSICSIRLH